MPKFFIQSFATAGDKTAIPEPVQATGAVSYNQGFGPDYSRIAGDPLKKDVPRNESNQLYFDITDNLGFWQRNGAPAWVPPAENGGSPLSYDRGAIVRFRDGPGFPYRTFVNQVDANTGAPDESDWIEFRYVFPPSSDTTSTNIPVDPAYVTARLASVTFSVPPASETVAGISEYATNDETIAGTTPNRTVTVTGLAAIAANKEWATPQASTTVSGRIRAATLLETFAFSLNNVAVTPATLGPVVAPATTSGGFGRVRLASPEEASDQSLGEGVAVPPNALTGYAKLGTNVSFTFVQSVNGFQKTSAEAVKYKLRRNNYGLLSVLRIKTGIGRYRPDYSADQSEHVFMFAGQLKKVVPLAVRSGGATYKGQPIDGIDYDMLVPVLVRAVKQLAGLSAISLLAAICALAFGG